MNTRNSRIIVNHRVHPPNETGVATSNGQDVNHLNEAVVAVEKVRVHAVERSYRPGTTAAKQDTPSDSGQPDIQHPICLVNPGVPVLEATKAHQRTC